jgi:hypothetical protein
VASVTTTMQQAVEVLLEGLTEAIELIAKYENQAKEFGTTSLPEFQAYQIALTAGLTFVDGIITLAKKNRFTHEPISRFIKVQTRECVSDRVRLLLMVLKNGGNVWP